MQSIAFRLPPGSKWLPKSTRSHPYLPLLLGPKLEDSSEKPNHFNSNRFFWIGSIFKNVNNQQLFPFHQSEKAQTVECELPAELSATLSLIGLLWFDGKRNSAPA
jgi:hypothetical protein